MATEKMSDNRLDRLEMRQAHTEADVSAIKTGMDTLLDAVRRLENKPPMWNNGTVISLVAVLFTILTGAGLYMESQMGHVKDDISDLRETQHMLEEFRHQMHYEVGVMQNNFKVNDDKWAHFDMLYHKLDDQKDEIDKRQQYNEGYKEGARNYRWGLGDK